MQIVNQLSDCNNLSIIVLPTIDINIASERINSVTLCNTILLTISSFFFGLVRCLFFKYVVNIWNCYNITDINIVYVCNWFACKIRQLGYDPYRLIMGAYVKNSRNILENCS